MSPITTDSVAALSSEAVRRAQAGGEPELTQALRSLYPTVHKHLSFLCGFRSDVDDIVQEAMIEVLRALPSYAHKSTLRSFALRIASRVAFRHLRRMSARRELALAAEDLGYDVDQENRDRVRQLQANLELLHVKKREAFLLMDVLGMTADEAAKVTGAFANTMQSRCRHARAELDALFAAQAEEEVRSGCSFAKARNGTTGGEAPATCSPSGRSSE